MNKLEKKLLFQFSQKVPGARVLAFFVIGSHLFNLNGPDSDKDYYGIYMPSYDQLKSGKWDKKPINLGTNQTNQKNNKDDVDCKFLAFDVFLTLLANSDFNMLELLYAPKEKVLVSSPEYEELALRRTMFTPFDLSSFVGFVKGEAQYFLVDESSFGKYTKLFSFLKQLPPSEKMTRHFDKLEEWNQESRVGYCTTSLVANDSKRVPTFKISTRSFQATNKVQQWVDQVSDIIDKFGDRQRKQTEDGAAYKALYHAMRLLFEAEDLLQTGQLNLPFDTTRHNLLKDIKSGKVPKEVLFPMVLEHLHYVDDIDQDRKMNQMHRLGAKHDEFRHWVSQYFLNKKMQVLLNQPKTNILINFINKQLDRLRVYFLNLWYNHLNKEKL